jgi:Tol biopolymer transport system component
VAGLLLIAALAAGAMWRTRRAPPDATSSVARVQRNPTRLTFGGGLQTDPTLSPDGRFLAFASDRSGNFDIWVQPVAGGNPVQITKEPDADTQPAWSPDGSAIVFRSEATGGGLFVVRRSEARLDSSPRLANVPHGPRAELKSCSSGTLHQRESGRGPLLHRACRRRIAERAGACGAFAGQLEMDRRASRRENFGRRHPHVQGPGFYTFSRSGEQLVKANISAVPGLLSPESGDRFRFTWNRTGTRLYVEATVKVINNLWRVEVDPTTLDWRSAERLTTGGGSDINAVLSPDESRIAYVQQTSAERLWSFPFDAVEGRLTGEGAPFSEEGAYASYVDLSRDGKAAVYNLVRPGGQRAEIWVHRFDTRHSKCSSRTDRLQVDTRWNSIVYEKWRNPNSNWESAIMLREPNGTERQLSDWRDGDSDLTPWDVTPDGHSILVSAYTRHTTPLWMWSLEGLRAKPEKVVIERPRTHIWQAQLSPNGKWVAFVPTGTDISQRQQVFLVRMGDSPTTEWTPLVQTLSITDKPRWAPGGRALYFLTSRGGFYNLAGIRFDPDRGVAAGPPFEVTHFSSPSLIISPFLNRSEMSIAARRAVLPMVSSTGSIWMLDNVDK